MDELLRFKFDQKYLVFDTETEGLNLVKSRPWQLSWVEAVGKKIIKKEDRLIFWEDLDVSEEAAKITGFNKSLYLKKAEDPAKVWADFSVKLYDPEYIIVGHNILGYDVYMLNVLTKLIGEKINFNFIKRCIDTNALAKVIAKGCQQVPNECRVPWMMKYINHRERGLKTNLKFLLEKYEINFDKDLLHNALYDIEKNYEVFLEQIKNIEI
jgi:DNA polymerase III epsilon subunit-like protein